MRIGTNVNFTSCSSPPNRKPDYVSRNNYGVVSSEYWYTKNCVWRKSNHWGRVGSNVWEIDGGGEYDTCTAMRIGFLQSLT